jgi:hypothetical protein
MSDYIEIDKKPVIFDDPEFCHNDDKRCKFLLGDSADCIFYESINGIDYSKRWVLKCDECKTAWKAAKLRQSRPCDECKDLIKIDNEGNFICDCHHCADHPAY